MLMPWNQLVTFLDSGIRELIETDFQQIRYGDVGMAVALAIVVGIILVLTLMRLAALRACHPARPQEAALDSRAAHGTQGISGRGARHVDFFSSRPISDRN
jgi:hypothetical protein